jgi:hypothetical protein
VAEHGFRHSVHVRIERAQQVAPFLRDTNLHHAPILAAAKARDESLSAEPVDDACDVGIARDHALPDLAMSEPLRMAASQDAQHVVLVGGQVGVGLEKRFPRLHDPGGRHAQAQQDLLLERGEGGLLLQLLGDNP